MFRDPAQFDLDRFVAAQRGVFGTALEELRSGRKRSHWMWFIFPQMRGLGQSATSHRYGVVNAGEAAAYLAHPLLGARLREATDAVLALRDVSVSEIFGSPDDLKFRSCMTLFAAVAFRDSQFDGALARYFGGVPDDRTLGLLAQNGGV